MADNLTVCAMSDELTKKLKEFRFRKEKDIAAILMKINKTTMLIEIEEEFKDIEDISDLQEELPDRQPRYLALSYVHKHDDGRVSYPLFFIYIAPEGCSPEQSMMYSTSKKVAQQNGSFTKDLELRSLEDLTEEEILKKLQLYK